MNKNLKLALIAAAAVSFSASAHDVTNALVNSHGHAVKGGFGQCIEVASNDASADCGAAAPAAKVMEVKFNLGAHTLFDTNKSDLRPAGQAELKDLAMKIKKGTELGQIKKVTGIRVTGHTDSRGSVAYNQGLSERRAASVRNYLVQLGIPAGIISANGEGEMNPVASNDTAAGRQQNRRVEVGVQGVATESVKN